MKHKLVSKIKSEKSGEIRWKKEGRDRWENREGGGVGNVSDVKGRAANEREVGSSTGFCVRKIAGNEHNIPICTPTRMCNTKHGCSSAYQTASTMQKSRCTQMLLQLESGLGSTQITILP